MHIDYGFGNHDVRCEVRDAAGLKVSCGLRGVHPDTVSYAVKRFLVKDGRMRASIARQSYRLRLEKGKRRKPVQRTLRGPAARFGLPGDTVIAAFTVSAEGALLTSAELRA